MEPTSEQGTKQGSSAWHATANHPACTKNYEWAPGAYARDRMADYNLKCRVSLLRVHVRNSNKQCHSNKRCALRKFDILSAEANWAYIGRFEMPHPTQTVSSKMFPNNTFTFRTVSNFHLRPSHLTWTQTESHMRQKPWHSLLVAMRPAMEKQWSRITMERAQQLARSSSKPLLVSGDTSDEDI